MTLTCATCAAVLEQQPGLPSGWLHVMLRHAGRLRTGFFLCATCAATGLVGGHSSLLDLALQADPGPTEPES